MKLMEQDFQVKEIKQDIKPIQPTRLKKKIRLPSFFRKEKLPKTLVIIGIVLIMVAAGAVLWGRHSFSKAKVELSIEVSEDIASGEEAVVSVIYRNKNRVNLYSAYLTIDYPSGTLSLDGEEIFQEQKLLGTISRKSEGKEEFRIRFIGEKEDIKNLSVKLDYQPQNINSRFENTATLKTEINSVLVGINIEGSEKIISGQEISYRIEYENKTSQDISNLRIKLNYSDDFEFEDAEPKPIEDTNNTWQVGVIKSSEKKEINLRGTLTGNEGESKVLEVVAGKMENGIFLKYTKSEFITQIAPSPLLLLLNIKGIGDEECNVDPGQRLDYKIEFKNNTDVALEELILKVYFLDDVFNFKNIALGDVGSFDGRENVITWSGGEVPALKLLEINQSGEVSFTITIKDSLPIFSQQDKNFKARVLAEIQTLTVPAKFSVDELRFENRLICKINSELFLESKVYYYEPQIGLVNSGPLPPKVDDLTTYTVHWQITNTSNNLENVKVRTILPQGTVWMDRHINKVGNSNFYYNERTKEIGWDISSVPAGTGVVSPLYELIFQIGLRPSINQVGQRPTLINESSVEGKDLFTEKTLKDFTTEVNTTLPDDSRVGTNQARVVE